MTPALGSIIGVLPRAFERYFAPARSRLVVRDGVEEVVVAAVEHGVDHAPQHAEHGAAAVLDLDVERAVAGPDVLDLVEVAARNEGWGELPYPVGRFWCPPMYCMATVLAG